MTSPTLHAVVIDDDPEVRGLHKRVLTPLGFEVILTANAADGIEAVRQFHPVVTVLDVTMPGMDGFAAARRIREFSNTYVLMVTGNTEEVDVVQGLGSGADDYISKPFRPRELRARIEAVLRRPRAIAVPTPSDPAAAGTGDVWRPGAVVEAPVERPAATVTAPAVEPQVPGQPLGDDTLLTPFGATRPGRDRAHLSGLSRTTRVDGVLARAQEPALAVGSARLAAVADVPAPQLVPDTGEGTTWLEHGSLALEPTRSVVRVDGEEIELPETELALLTTLLESGRRIRSTANLVLALRGESYVTTYYVNEADKNAVKTHMESLLRRLGDTGATPRWIESVRGVGYRMTAV